MCVIRSISLVEWRTADVYNRTKWHFDVWTDKYLSLDDLFETPLRGVGVITAPRYQVHSDICETVMKVAKVGVSITFLSLQSLVG